MAGPVVTPGDPIYGVDTSIAIQKGTKTSLGDYVAGIIDKIDSTTLSFTQASYEGLASATSPLFTSYLVIAIAHGLASGIFGAAQFSLSTVARLYFRYFIIWFLTINWAFFFNWFYSALTSIPDDVVKIILTETNITGDANNNYTGIVTLVTGFVDVMDDIADAFWEDAGVTNVGAGFAWVIMALVSLFLAAGAAVIIGGTKVVIALFGAIAPLMFFASLWPMTKGLFDGWLRVLLGSAFTYLLTMLLFAFLLNVGNEIVDNGKELDNVSSFGEISKLLLFSFICLFMLRLVPGYGAAVAGTIASGFSGFHELRTAGGNAHGAYNRAHGLRSSGYKNESGANRREARARARQRLMGLFTAGGSGSGTRMGPIGARAAAESAAHRKEAVQSKRPQAAREYLSQRTEEAEAPAAMSDLAKAHQLGAFERQDAVDAARTDAQSLLSPDRKG